MERFAGLGIDRMVMESNLRLAIAQRLEQRLCPHCAHRPTTEVSQWLARHDRSGLATNSKARQRFEQGCSNCCAGIRGRVPILEWASLESLDGKRRPHVHQTIEEARLVRALRGEIDSLEVSRVCL